MAPITTAAAPAARAPETEGLPDGHGGHARVVALVELPDGQVLRHASTVDLSAMAGAPGGPWEALERVFSRVVRSVMESLAERRREDVPRPSCVRHGFIKGYPCGGPVDQAVGLYAPIQVDQASALPAYRVAASQPVCQAHAGEVLATFHAGLNPDVLVARLEPIGGVRR